MSTKIVQMLTECYCLNYYTWYHMQSFKRPIVQKVNSTNCSSSIIKAPRLQLS